MIFRGMAGVMGAVGVAATVMTGTAQAVAITGTVTTSDGKRVAGATVIVGAYVNKCSVYSHAVKTDPDGRFSVEPPKDAFKQKTISVSVYVIAPGFAFARVFVKSGESAAVSLKTEQLVRGTVRDESGAPVADAKVVLTGVLTFDSKRSKARFYNETPVPFATLLETRTDAEGNWQLGGVPAPDESNPQAIVSLKDSRFVVATGRRKDDAPLEEIALVARVGGTIMGRVTDSGKPAVGVPVTAHSMDGKTLSVSGLTDGRGAFHLERVGAGKYFVHANGKSRNKVNIAITEVVVETSKTTSLPAPIALIDGSFLTGKVVNKTTGTGIGNVLLMITGAQFPVEWHGSDTVFTEKNGTFRVRVAPGKTTMQIISAMPGYKAGDYRQSVTVTAGRTQSLPPIAVELDIPPALQVLP